MAGFPDRARRQKLSLVRFIAFAALSLVSHLLRLVRGRNLLLRLEVERVRFAHRAVFVEL